MIGGDGMASGDCRATVGVAGLSGEDLARLLDNPFVDSYSGKRITYSRDFNVAMHNAIQSGLTYVEAYKSLGFDVSVLGENRAYSAGKRVERLAEAGKLLKTDPACYDGAVPPEQMGNMAPEEEIAYLRARNRYLEAVIEAQKKLRSLLATR